ncbi:MAG: right-handed parallel beta-helix repeat-containing protein [Planctomycetota bacterium]
MSQPTLHRTIAALASAISLSAAAAGPLTPPAGPITSTGMTTDQIEPRTPISEATTITEPGSYYLTGNLVVTGNAIDIAVPGVTLDLNGFSIIGDGQGPDAGITVSAVGGQLPVVIRNGFVRRFDDDGIRANADGADVTIERVTVDNCFRGFDMVSESVLIDCRAVNCTDIGIRTFGRSILERCIAENGGNLGFRGEHGIFINCIARANAGGGFVLGTSGTATTDAANRFEGCTSAENGGVGFQSDDPAQLSGCIARNNAGNGFTLADNARMTDCVSDSNDAIGIQVGNGVIITGSSSSSNGQRGVQGGNAVMLRDVLVTGSGGFGINLGLNARVTDSTSSENGNDGVLVGEGSTVTDSLAALNAGDGFQVGARSKIIACHAEDNDSAGIRGAADVTIDSNFVTLNATGIVGVSGTLVMRNTAAANSNNFSVSGASVGQIFQLAPNAAFNITNSFANVQF